MAYSPSVHRRSLRAARNADGLEIFDAVNAIDESWSCPSCGMRFASTPPEHRLCCDCLGQLELLGYEPAPAPRTVTCHLASPVEDRWWRSCQRSSHLIRGPMGGSPVKALATAQGRRLVPKRIIRNGPR